MGNSWTECTICRNEPQHCKCENPLTDPEFDKLIREGTSMTPVEDDGFPEERMEEAKAEYEQFGSSFSIWHAGRWGYAEGLKAGNAELSLFIRMCQQTLKANGVLTKSDWETHREMIAPENEYVDGVE